MSTRLQILEASLAKKRAAFDEKLNAHYESVRSANGQPLNDKRGGAATMQKWERQNEALRRLDDGIKLTEAAIEREKSKIAATESVKIPEFMREMVSSGELIQWRRHPNTFFVNGVERGRIVLREDGSLAHRYAHEIPVNQRQKFRDVYNGLRRRMEMGQ